MSCFNGLQDICRADVPLAELTWYGLGGPARWLLTPRNEEELCDVLRRCQEHAVPWRVLGRGANVLVRDEGYAGAVLTLTGPYWEEITLDAAPTVQARAGADFPRLVRTTLQHGLVGLENLAGIPGTVGGAVRMNAGGKHGTLAQYIESVRLVLPDGTAQERTKADMGFGYRQSRLDGGIICAATLTLEPGDETTAMERYRAIWNEKYGSQPPVSAKSAGCVFKNPPGQAAGKLIDQAGLKGRRAGGAEISPLHANFIVAHPGATAADVLELIEVAKERVRSTTGIELQLEVEIW